MEVRDAQVLDSLVADGGVELGAESKGGSPPHEELLHAQPAVRPEEPAPGSRTHAPSSEGRPARCRKRATRAATRSRRPVERASRRATPALAGSGMKAAGNGSLTVSMTHRTFAFTAQADEDGNVKGMATSRTATATTT